MWYSEAPIFDKEGGTMVVLIIIFAVAIAAAVAVCLWRLVYRATLTDDEKAVKEIDRTVRRLQGPSTDAKLRREMEELTARHHRGEL